mmetsp:Transcript_14590/g.35213  ORF Transcript_14590/g.35213 Transcript_14590/m.35213 type:complete len:210 (+) Transcript_14590:978-1607(+)
MIPVPGVSSSTVAASPKRSATTPASSTPASPPPTTATRPPPPAPLLTALTPFIAAAMRCASSSVDSGMACSRAPGTPMSDVAVPTATTSQSYSTRSPLSSSTAPPPLLPTDPSRMGMGAAGSMFLATPRWNATPVGARSSVKRGATSQSLMLSFTSSYSMGLNTKRSLRSTSVTRGFWAPAGHVRLSSFSAVYRPPKPPPRTTTRGAPI